jgi:hypothetical protein
MDVLVRKKIVDFFTTDNQTIAEVESQSSLYKTIIFFEKSKLIGYFFTNFVKIQFCASINFS